MADDITRKSGQAAKFDPSHFKLQPDGTFRISIRGMAGMAGVDDGALSRSLKSAAAENPLPCARSLLAHGFCPSAVSTWGETGGIPEDAAPFILEHYGINAASPSAQARAVLLAFTRVGINAYLKERLGVVSPPPAGPEVQGIQPASNVIEVAKGQALIYDLMKDRGLMNDVIALEFQRSIKYCAKRLDQTLGLLPGIAHPMLNAALPSLQGKAVDLGIPVTVVEFAVSYLDASEQRLVEKADQEIGREAARLYRLEYDREPSTTDHISVAGKRHEIGLALWGESKRGFRCKPKVYYPSEWVIVVEAIKNKGAITADRAALLLAEIRRLA